MRITILTVGKLKEKYWKDAVAEYTKRLSKYAKVDVAEVADEKTPDSDSPSLIRMVKEKEGERLLKAIRKDTYVITLEIEGEMPDSIRFAGKIKDLSVSGKSDLTFIIGGSVGLSDEVCRRADYHLSFSRFTFPHQLMRVILLEQIYRAFRIIQNEPYHK